MTDDGSLTKTKTAQNIAFKQLLSTNPDLDPAVPADQIEITQRYALNTIYYSSTGDKWTTKNGWTTASDICGDQGSKSWFGITCKNQQVTSLELGGNNLVGTIPSEIRGLSTLEKYDMNKNTLFGAIPSAIGQLNSLGMFFAVFPYPPCVCPFRLNLMILKLIYCTVFFDVFTNFIGVDADFNPIKNALPESIANLTNLEILNLNANFLAGPVPVESLVPMSKLRFLDLFFNEFTGPIPTTVGLMSSLEYLDLSQNGLEGVLPTELGRLTALTDLRVAKTDLREIPDGLCEPKCIAGSIPTEIANLVNLRKSQNK